MRTLSEKECIALIKKGECFHAEVDDGAFIVKIDEYAPIICAAIHNGHRLRSDLTKTFLVINLKIRSMVSEKISTKTLT